MTRSEISQYYYLKREAENADSLACELEKKLDGLHGENRDFVRKQIQKQLEKRERCLKMHEQIEEFIENVNDSLIRQVLFERYIRGKSWTAVAMAVGGGNTPDGVRKTADRFFAREG